MNKEGRIIEPKCSPLLSTLLKLYYKYNDDFNIDSFYCIDPSRSFYSVQSDAVGKTRHRPSRSKRILSMEEKLIRVKENIVLAKAEAFDHILNKFDNNTQVTSEDVFEILKPIKKLLNDIEFIKYAQL